MQIALEPRRPNPSEISSSSAPILCASSTAVMPKTAVSEVSLPTAPVASASSEAVVPKPAVSEVSLPTAPVASASSEAVVPKPAVREFSSSTAPFESAPSKAVMPTPAVRKFASSSSSPSTKAFRPIPPTSDSTVAPRLTEAPVGTSKRTRHRRATRRGIRSKRRLNEHDPILENRVAQQTADVTHTSNDQNPRHQLKRHEQQDRVATCPEEQQPDREHPESNPLRTLDVMRSGPNNTKGSKAKRKLHPTCNNNTTSSRREARFNSFMTGERSQFLRARQPSWKDTTTGSHDDKPLHAPEVPMMAQVLFQEMLNDPTVPEVHKKALNYLFDESLYAFPSSQPQRQPRSKVTRQDVELLKKLGLCEEGFRTSAFGYLFTTFEAKKKRRRLVHDTLSTNFLVARPPSPRFTPLRNIPSLIHKGTHCVTFDLRAMYYQIGLAPMVRQFFPFEFEGTRYQFTRLPMGFSWSVIIAQAISLFLTRALPHVHVEVYIDNVIIVGTKEAVSAAADIFRQRCANYSVTLSEDSGVQTIGTFRGIQMDFANKTFRLDEAFVQKVRDRLRDADGSWCDWRALIGTVIYGCTALSADLSTIFYVLKWLARNVRTNPSSKVTMWTHARTQWETICRKILANEPRGIPPEAHPTATIITDACTETNLVAAIVITTGGKLVWFAYQQPTYSSINDLEALAFCAALSQFKHIIRNRTVVWFSDNRSALHALDKAYSPSFALNQVISRTVHDMREGQSTIHSVWIPSEDNPADAPSRTSSLPYIESMRAHELHRWAQRVCAPSFGGGVMADGSSSDWLFVSRALSFPFLATTL